MKRISIVLFALVLAACGEESDIQKAVKTGLKDPDSAKFGSYSVVTSKKGGTYACITVNAKNSMGGYVGNKEAVVQKSKDGWDLLTTIDFGRDMCLQTTAEL